MSAALDYLLGAKGRNPIDRPGYHQFRRQNAREIATEYARKAQENSPGHKESSSKKKKDHETIEERRARLEKEALKNNPQLMAGYFPNSLNGLIRPVGSFRMPGEAGDFGPRINPATGRAGSHTGMDMSEAAGTPIYAAASGTVEFAGWDPIYGNKLQLFHGTQRKTGVRYDTMYGHLQEYIVKQGQKIAQGEKIGYVGTTGLSTGNHLHFETWENREPVNPIKYLTDKDRDDLKRVNGMSISQAAAKGDERTGFKNASSKTKQAPDIHKLSAKDFDKIREENPLYTRDFWDLEHNTRQENLEDRLGKVRETKNDVITSGRPDTDLEAFLNAIAEQESGGDNNYGAVGVPTKYGQAYGKYQILDSNIEGPGGWDEAALGRNISIDEFLHTPQLQELIARKKLTDYYKKYGPEGAAKAWYGGEGVANTSSNSSQYGGPSINGYASDILETMGHYR
jgi:hypothetical protein